jgi:pimeloyl-ACP methyl ester carboxylesterase
VRQAVTGNRMTPASARAAAILAVLALVAGCAANVQSIRPESWKRPGSTKSARPVKSSLSARSTVSSPRPSASATPAPAVVGVAGTYEVGEHHLTFTEPAHTGPTGESLGRRKLVTQIWYPRARRSAGAQSARGPFPLVVFAPGFLICADDYSHLLETWASAGYVVAAVNFPHTNCDASAQTDESDLVNQPHDVSYVLDSLLALNAQPGNALSGLLNPLEVAAVGHSDGGDTAAALAANTCCTDHRLTAVAVLSGQEWPMPGQYFAHKTVPMLFVQGSADTVNAPSTNLLMYLADRAPARYYFDLLGASHLTPYVGTNPIERLVARVTLEFFDRYVLGQSGATGKMTHDGNVSGKAALVSGGQPPP